MPAQELFAFKPRKTGRQTGQGTQMHARIMRGLEGLAATKHFVELTSSNKKEVFLSVGGRHTGEVWTTLQFMRDA
eukprot:12418799-Karenia_brevis.AAC.1